MGTTSVKSLHLAPIAIETRPLPDGGLVLRSRHELQPYPRCLGVHLHHWAAAAPDRTFLAERDSEGGWRRVTYREALDAVERIASALLERGLVVAIPTETVYGLAANALNADAVLQIENWM